MLDRGRIECIAAKARELGASLSGLTPVASVLDSPSCRVHHRVNLGATSGSVLVLALVHPTSHPQLDYWGGSGGTEGNRQLHEISEKLTGWLGEEFGLCGRALPYQVSSGGAYVKDAALLAGMGVMGRNNLLITREFGPRVRLRAMLLEVECESAAPLDFSPCDDCGMPCQSACPRDAFAGGSFSRQRCMIQMDEDRKNASASEHAGASSKVKYVSYCRACERACPVGRGD